MAGQSAFARSRFLRLCVRRSFIIWYDWGGWWNQLWLLSGHKFSYCAVVSKNGFCYTDLFLQELFFFHVPISCYQSFPFLFPLHFFFFFSCIFLFFSSLLLFLLLLWSKARIFRWWFALLWVSESSIRHWRKKIPVFPIKSTLHHHQCVSCLTPRREYNWLRWSESMK